MNTKSFDHRHTVLFLFAFISPIVLLLVVFLRLGVTPFGDVTFLGIDMSRQYSAFLTYLRSIFFGNNDIFYSFNMNSGGNFYFLFSYYLANPINWILALVTADKIPCAISWLVLFRFGLAGLSSAFYLRKLFPRLFGWKTLLFSTSYSLMSFMLIQAENYFFIDGVILLPIILVGIDYLIEGKSFTWYTVGLSFLLLIQFYIGYMINIFSVIYFLFKFFLHINEFDRKITLLRFILGSFLAGLIAAVILVPVGYGLSGSVKSISNQIFTLAQNFSLLEFLTKNIFGAYNYREFQSFSLPEIYSGSLITLFTMLFFTKKSITKREKLLTAFVFFFLWISLSSFGLNVMWHGFSEPQGWPYRFAFLFTFWMVRTSYLAWTHPEPISMRLLSVFTLISAFLSFLPLLNNYLYISFQSCLIEFLFFMALLFISCQISNFSLERNYLNKFFRLIAIIVAVNLIGNSWTIFSQSLTANLSESIYLTHIDTQKTLVDQFRKNNSQLIRGENLTMIDANDPMRLGYNGISHFSSTVKNQDVLLPLKRLGVHQYYYFTTFTDGLPLAAISFLGIQFIISVDGKILNNETALPIGFFVPQAIFRSIRYPGNPYEYLNDIFQTLINENPGLIYEPVNFDLSERETGTTWTINVEDRNPIYLFTFQEDKKPNQLTVGSVSRDIITGKRESVLLGSFHPGDKISLTSFANGGYEGMSTPSDRIFFKENIALLKQYSDIIQTQGVSLEKISASHLRGAYSAEKEQPYLLFSILYDEGWKAFVDGKEKLIIPALEHFMMIQTDQGTHEFELKYIPPGFQIGGIVSMIGIGLFIFVSIHGKWSGKVKTSMGKKRIGN